MFRVFAFFTLLGFFLLSCVFFSPEEQKKKKKRRRNTMAEVPTFKLVLVGDGGTGTFFFLR
jgi:phosphatidate phosphatase APP1